MDSTVTNRNVDRAGKHPQGSQNDEGTSATDGLLAIETLLQQVSLLLIHLTRLARTEARMALALVPAYVRCWLLVIPLLLLSWVAFSLFVSWGSFVLWNNSVIATFIFFVLQVLASLAVTYRLKKLTERMRFPYTTRQWQAVKETLLDEPS